MKTKSFILYKVLKKIIISINEIVREFNKRNFEMIKRIFKYKNRKKNSEGLKKLK